MEPAPVIAATLGWLALGLPVATAFLRRGHGALALGAIPAAAGLAILIPLQLAAWTDGSLTGWIWRAAVASVCLGLAAEGLLMGTRRAPDPQATVADRRGPWTAMAALVLLGFAVWSVHSGLVLSEGVPTFEWDAYQIWLLRAKVLAESDVLPRAFWSEEQIERSQWNYPMWLPAYLAWHLRYTPLQLFELQLPLGILAAVVPFASFALLLRCTTPLVAACVALAPFAVSNLLWLHFTAIADPLLILLVVPGGVAALSAARSGDAPLAAASGITLAAALAVKNDATLWLASIGVGVGLSILRHRPAIRAAVGDALRIVVPGALVFLFWSATTRHLGLTNELPVGSDPLSRVSAVADAVSLRFVAPIDGTIIVACVGALFFALRGRFRDRLVETGIVLSVPLVYLAGILVIYLTIYLPPHLDIRWMILTSFDRLTLGIVPMIFGQSAVAAISARAIGCSRGP